MAGKGAAPKAQHSRERDTARRGPQTVVVPDGKLRGPELPRGVKWPAATRRWWATWRASPQAQTMTDTDWDFLLDTALLHKRFWEGSMSCGPELRLRVAKFGATKEDRLRLREQVGKPDPKPQGEEKGESHYAHLRSVGA
jgi:hypothetical protein